MYKPAANFYSFSVIEKIENFSHYLYQPPANFYSFSAIGKIETKGESFSGENKLKLPSRSTSFLQPPTLDIISAVLQELITESSHDNVKKSDIQ